MKTSELIECAKKCAIRDCSGCYEWNCYNCEKNSCLSCPFNGNELICCRDNLIIALADRLEQYEKALNKYRWHDLRKNPEDLPKEHHNYYPIEDSSFSDNVLVVTDRWHRPIVAYINLSVKLWHNPLTEKTFEDECLGEVIAWREIEPFKDECLGEVITWREFEPFEVEE